MRWLCAFAVVLLNVARASGWGPSTHAYLAKQVLEPGAGETAEAYAALGAVTPDFFWYLSDLGVIDADTAFRLHGVTEEPEVLESTTFFYDFFSETFGATPPMSYMAEGIRTHVYADVLAHNRLDGYVEGSGKWVDVLAARTGEWDRDALHLALEFAADALLVHHYGPQLQTIDTGSLPDDLPALREFKDYLSLLQSLEAVAGVYGAYLVRSVENPPVSQKHGNRPWAGSASPYVGALRIVVLYPRDILETLTIAGVHWQADALGSVTAGIRSVASLGE